MPIIQLDSKASDDVRRQALFEGQFFLFSPRQSFLALCNYAKELIEEAFRGIDPQRAQFSMSVKDFVAIVEPLKSKFTNHSYTKELVREVLADFGCDLNKTYFDVPRLRVVSHGGYLSAGVGYAYRPHRDTWYSSSLSQVNYWLPVYPLEPENGMVLYPSYWKRSILNSSSEFNYDEWRRVGRPSAISQIKVEARKHPLPQEQIDPEQGLRIVCDSGAILLFSGAHLHATFPNTSGVTRFSLDFRSVNIDDVVNNCGAENVDSSATGTTLVEFLQASNFSPMPSELIQQSVQ